MVKKKIFCYFPVWSMLMSYWWLHLNRYLGQFIGHWYSKPCVLLFSYQKVQIFFCILALAVSRRLLCLLKGFLMTNVDMAIAHDSVLHTEENDAPKGTFPWLSSWLKSQNITWCTQMRAIFERLQMKEWGRGYCLVNDLCFPRPEIDALLGLEF